MKEIIHSYLIGDTLVAMYRVNHTRFIVEWNGESVFSSTNEEKAEEAYYETTEEAEEENGFCF